MTVTPHPFDDAEECQGQELLYQERLLIRKSLIFLSEHALHKNGADATLARELEQRFKDAKEIFLIL